MNISASSLGLLFYPRGPTALNSLHMRVERGLIRGQTLAYYSVGRYDSHFIKNIPVVTRNNIMKFVMIGAQEDYNKDNVVFSFYTLVWC